MSTVPLYIGGTVKCIGRECAHFFVIAITVINMGGAFYATKCACVGHACRECQGAEQTGGVSVAGCSR